MRIDVPFLAKNKPVGGVSLANTGGLLVQDAGGSWSQAAREGRMFTGGSAAGGTVLPIYSATAQKLGLWNPQDSGVNAILTQVALTYRQTIGAAGGFVLASVPNAAGIGTAAPVGAFTDGVLGTTIHNALVGSLIGPKCRFTPSAATVVAPALYRHIGLNQLVLTPTDATSAQWLATVDFPGDVILPPGTAIFVAGNIATLVTLAGSMTWVEEAA